MQLVNPRIIIYKLFDWDKLKKLIELHARRCYRSEGKIDEGSAEKIIKKLVDMGHHAMIEHSFLSIEATCDRGVTHEWVRHRLPAYAQQSTRYCDEGSEEKFGGVNFIEPFFFEPSAGKKKTIIPKVFFSRSGESCIALSKETADTYEMNAWDVWMISCLWSEWAYNTLRDEFGAKPQEARAVLPNCLRTVIGCSCNLREWRHILDLRTKKAAHPQIRQIMIPILHFLNDLYPEIFGGLMDNIAYKYEEKKILLPEIEIVDVLTDKEKTIDGLQRNLEKKK